MEKEQALQALLDQVVRQGDFIGVSALYLRDGKQLVYAQAGMADRERGIPFARDTICRVFSMSKPITAFAVMKLWEDGKLDLDAPVAAYLPEFGDAEHTNLTIRQLLCMTSGYGYNDNDSVQSAGLGRLYDEISESFTKGGQRTTRQVIAEMAKLPLLYRPGKGWRYGVSADILAAAVEAASGMNYRDFLKQNLLDPLEMVDTDFYVPEAKRGRLAQAYDFNSGAAVPDVVNHLGTLMTMAAGTFAFRGWCVWRLDEYNMVVNQLANFLDIYALGMGAALLYVWLVQCYPAAEKRKAMAWQGIATLLCVLSTWGMLRIFRVQAGESGQAALQAGQMMRRPLLGLAVAGILLTLPFAARPLRFLMGNRVMGWLAAVSMNYYLLHQNLAVHLKRLGVPPSVSAEPNRAGEQPWQLQYTLLCFGLSLLGAALITLLIEKPCAKVLKKMFARGKAENKA